MRADTRNDILLLGAVTGMRSMAGPAALAFSEPWRLRYATAALAVGEMIADKTTLVGDRIDPAPLTGRCLMGALVGGVLARRASASVPAGALLGAASAVIAAHLAYRLRKRLPLPGAVGGVLEDGIVLTVCASHVSRELEERRP